MAATIRLLRLGKKNNPFYRIIVTDRRKKREGKYIEELGFYNPMTEPLTIKVNRDRLQYWVNKGAVFSQGMLKLLKKKIKIDF